METTPRKYHYYVTYNHPQGFGATEMICTAPIQSWDAVERIRQLIAQNNVQLGNVVVVNWVLLRTTDVASDLAATHA